MYGFKFNNLAPSMKVPKQPQINHSSYEHIKWREMIFSYQFLVAFSMRLRSAVVIRFTFDQLYNILGEFYGRLHEKKSQTAFICKEILIHPRIHIT
jgi:hypothetical protein